MNNHEERTHTTSVHYYQGGYDFQFVSGLDPVHECPICLLCQRDPHQTSCGHSCQNSDNGCPVSICIGDCESHLSSCKFGPLPQTQQLESVTCTSCGDLFQEHSMAKHQSLICPNKLVACSFTSIGCAQKIPRKQLQHHLASETGHHMQLLAEKLAKVQQLQQAEQVMTNSYQEEDQPSSSLPSSPRLNRGHQDVLRMSGSNMHAQSKLIRELYKKVVSLEQKGHQQEIKIEQLEQQLARTQLDQDDDQAGRYCNGSFIWKIRNFFEIHQKMRKCHSFVVYSKGFYTSVFGYKMCLRSNIYYAEGDEHLGVFLHLMRGENDDCLTWPWGGGITLTIVNQREGIIRRSYEKLHKQ